ncbi:MAG TPA: glycosyltransferase family 39 protein [Acidobacteriaceae bacterium]
MSIATPQNTAAAAHQESFRSFLWICLAFAALKLAIHVVGNILAQHAGYGIFRDEMYYLICGRHLAFGYVDQPPLVALQARLSDLLFGYSRMWSLRLISALAGALTVFLTGAIVWALRGTRSAAALAMLGVTVAGVFLGLDSFLSMNSFDPVFWMLCTLALIRIVAEHGVAGRERRVRFWWIALGISAGLGLENKDTIVFFLVAVLIALLLTPQRRILASRWFALALALIVLLALPNLLWQIHYHFPTLEWLVTVSHSNKDTKLSPLAFIGQQIMTLTPWTAALWITGIVWLLAARRARPNLFLGVLYPVFLLLMLALHAKDYYLAAIYPLYFAAGAICWLPAPDPNRASTRRSPLRTTLVSAYALLLCIGFVLTVPFSIPVLPPQQLVAWMKTMRYQAQDSENHAATILPQFYADRFGWHQMVEKVAQVYNALPPRERAITGVLADNYGEASAVNLFGPRYGLPLAISGHQTYWLWGPRGYSGQEMILITGDSLADLKPYYASCQVTAQLDDPLAMPWEHKNVYLCRGRFRSYQADWKDFKHYY